MKFKTNAKCMGCVTAIRSALRPLAPAEAWSFDLDSPDRIMTYTGTAPADAEAFAAEVINTIGNAGFKAERIG